MVAGIAGLIMRPLQEKDYAMKNMIARLSQANVDHFNNHPKTHIAIVVVYTVVAVYTVNNLTDRIVEKF